MLGLPFAFASHFAPASLMQALEIYREPLPAVGAARAAATPWSASTCSPPTPTTRRGGSFTSLQQQFVNLRRGTPGPLPPPVDSMDDIWSPRSARASDQSLAVSAVGTPDMVERALKTLIAQTGADELMVTGQIYDHAARLRSFEIASRMCAIVSRGASHRTQSSVAISPQLTRRRSTDWRTDFLSTITVVTRFTLTDIACEQFFGRPMTYVLHRKTDYTDSGAKHLQAFNLGT